MQTTATRSTIAGRAYAALMLAALFFLPNLTHALPRFALQTGQRCASCHVNMSGGGQRTEGGWWSMKNIGLINPKSTFLEPLYSAESNTLFSPKVSWGFDYRFQIANRPNSEGNFERDYFSMQFAPYVTYKPVEEVSVYGAYNVVEPLYPSQQHGFGGVTYTPVEELSVKAGFIQPNFGVRHDDHTTFTRIRGGVGYYPYYAELGGEAYVTPLEWLTFSGGVYSSGNRHDDVDAISSDAVFYTGNAKAIYTDFDMGLNLEAGATSAFYDVQMLYGGHIGIGWIDNGSLLLEYLRREDDFARPASRGPQAGATYMESADILLAKISYELIEGLSFVGRWEQAQTTNDDYSDGSEETYFIERQWVAGFQVFVIPNLELRPEYRWYDGPRIRLAQYTLQLHLFY